MSRRPTRQEVLIGGLSLAVTIVLCVLIVQHRDYLDRIAHWGYVGCFFINILASGTLVMPGFGMILTFTLGGVLNPALVGVVAGIGEAIGAIGAYFTGYGGRGLFRGNTNTFYLRFNRIVARHGSKAVFFMASLLNPIYYPFAVFLGMVRFGWVKFFFATWAGRTVKNVMVAYLGYLGLRSVLRWLGWSF